MVVNMLDLIKGLNDLNCFKSNRLIKFCKPADKTVMFSVNGICACDLAFDLCLL